MKIRKSTLEDVDRILEIFAIAKGFMDAQGNTTQWEPGYPGRQVVEQDVENGNICNGRKREGGRNLCLYFGRGPHLAGD